jgi:putative ABC transport system ATP-binding protein
VRLPLLSAGPPPRPRRRLAIEALRRVGLEGRLHHQPSQLSGGQQQRVAIARALVTSPRVILADEPTGNLDSKMGMEVMDLFSELNRQGITIVLVTHEPDIAAYARRLVVVKDGLVCTDEPTAARALPLAAFGREARR